MTRSVCVKNVGAPLKEVVRISFYVAGARKN